jgi:uncharacterized OsmC-like protein
MSDGLHRTLDRRRHDLPCRDRKQSCAGNGRLAAERADTDPKVFTRIHMHFTVRGKALKRSLVEHAIRLSHEKYCSASAMLGKTAEMTKDFELIEE